MTLPFAVLKVASPASVQRYAGATLTIVAVALCGWGAVRWAGLLGSEPQAVATTSDTRAWALLGRALHANSEVPFSARVETVVFVGERSQQSDALLSSTPEHLTITYLSGPLKGQRRQIFGSDFWRREADESWVPLASVAGSPDEIARRRFELMRANYQAQLQPPTEVEGRPVEVVELRPARPTDEFGGPARRVFLDDATGLALRIEEFNALLQPISHSTFSRLDLHAEARHNAPPTPQSAGAFGWHGQECGDDVRAVIASSGLEPPQTRQIPRGWKRDGHGVYRDGEPDSAATVAAFTRYTDGLNVLMIFALKNASSSGATLPASCGFGPGTLVSRADGAGTLLAVGDLPPPVLQRALEGARFREISLPAATTTPLAPAVPVAR